MASKVGAYGMCMIVRVIASVVGNCMGGQTLVWRRADRVTKQLVCRLLQLLGPSWGVAREDDVAARAVMLGRDRELEGGV